MSEKGHTEHPDEQARPAAAEDAPDDVQDVDMDPEDHVNRPEQPDFDPAEKRPYEDPTAGELPPGVDQAEDR